jgi:hypothetical protein
MEIKGGLIYYSMFFIKNLFPHNLQGFIIRIVLYFQNDAVCRIKHTKMDKISTM